MWLVESGARRARRRTDRVERVQERAFCVWAAILQAAEAPPAQLTTGCCDANCLSGTQLACVESGQRGGKQLLHLTGCKKLSGDSKRQQLRSLGWLGVAQLKC